MKSLFPLLLAARAATACAAHLELQGGVSYLGRHPASAAFIDAVTGPGHPIGGSAPVWSPDFSLG